MESNLAQERQQAHALLDKLHEEVLADFGLTIEDWEKMGSQR